LVDVLSFSKGRRGEHCVTVAGEVEDVLNCDRGTSPGVIWPGPDQ
jgi:hypothetical protein